MKVHIVFYAQGEPYETSKKLMMNSIPKDFIVHEYNFDTIKSRDWFSKIENLPMCTREGRRDGYYCAYKAHIVNEVFESLEHGDKLLYFDCSQHYVEGFKEKFDKMLEYECIAGLGSTDFKNFTHLLCHDVSLWNKLYPGQYQLFDISINASIFLFTKNDFYSKVVKEYADHCVYPWVTLHIGGDQAILNILIHKYNLPVFFHPDVKHFESRNKNTILNKINNSPNCVMKIKSINPLGYKEPFQRKIEKILTVIRIFCINKERCYIGKREELSNICIHRDLEFDDTKKYSFIYIDEQNPDLFKYYNSLIDRGIMIVDNVGVYEEVNKAVWNFRPFLDSTFDIMFYIKI